MLKKAILLKILLLTVCLMSSSLKAMPEPEPIFFDVYFVDNCDMGLALERCYSRTEIGAAQFYCASNNLPFLRIYEPVPDLRFVECQTTEFDLRRLALILRITSSCDDVEEFRNFVSPDLFETLVEDCSEEEEPDEPDGRLSISLATKNSGSRCGVGNPCHPATGNKFQTEVDFSYGDLSFTRFYNSLNLVNLGLGQGWRTTYQPRLAISGDTLTLVSSSGKGEPWVKVGDEWQGDQDSDVLLEQLNGEFVVTYPDTSFERYNLDGQLTVQTSKNGHNTTYRYSEGQLVEIENIYGRKILFSYLDDLLETVTDPEGAVYEYLYENDNLVTVIFPDLTPEIISDNPRKTYHYEDNDFPHHLTGITDENGDRYATWSYDDEGRAISSEHAQTTNDKAQEKVELDFQDEN